MNIKDFLISNSIDYTLYKLSITEIYDIILYDKLITQSVKTELRQYREKDGDWLDENKKEFSKSHRFLKNDLPVGHHKIRGIEPDTLQFDDCKSCDGHGSIVCTECSGKGEVVCPKCLGKTQFLVDVQRQRQTTGTCQACGGRGNYVYPCKKCAGTGSIKYYEPCQVCYGKGKILNQQTNQYMYCQQCRGMGRIEKNAPCQICASKGQIIQSCQKCNGSGQYMGIENYIEKVMTSCTYCGQTGRVRCSVCNGQQELTCGTCHGERKTHQCYMNTFEVDVKNSFSLLLNRAFSQDSIDTIGLEPKNTVTKIDENEKKLLVAYGTSENLKVGPESISRVNGTLYKLESLESGEHYFIWHSKTRDQYFYISLPPKSNLEEFFVALYRPIFRFFSKVYSIFTSFMKALKNKKDY